MGSDGSPYADARDARTERERYISTEYVWGAWSHLGTEPLDDGQFLAGNVLLAANNDHTVQAQDGIRLLIRRCGYRNTTLGAPAAQAVAPRVRERRVCVNMSTASTKRCGSITTEEMNTSLTR